MSKIAWTLFAIAVALGLAAVWVTPATIDTKLGGTAIIALGAAFIVAMVADIRSDA